LPFRAGNEIVAIRQPFRSSNRAAPTTGNFATYIRQEMQQRYGNRSDPETAMTVKVNSLTESTGKLGLRVLESRIVKLLFGVLQICVWI
jgi:hypothetical protein